jgi:pseudouridine-5'-phosphate glycosidase
MMSNTLQRPAPPDWIRLSSLVSAAFNTGRPVVALESTVLTHGLPRPVNLDLALRVEADLRAAGVEPATIGIHRGRVTVGLAPEEIEELALAEAPEKVSGRDLAWAHARGSHGGTTVAATMYVAHRAGLRLFSTGGIGGVHRGKRGDVSADLPELARTPVAVVCSGAKSILDLPRTLEWLETGGVPVLGWRTDRFPAFFSHSTDLPIPRRVESAEEVAAFLRAHWEMGLAGVLVCVPCPEEEAIPAAVARQALERAEAAAEEGAVRGQAVTPFLLSRMAEFTGGETMRANLALLRNNALVAAEVAKALQP